MSDEIDNDPDEPAINPGDGGETGAPSVRASVAAADDDDGGSGDSSDLSDVILGAAGGHSTPSAGALEEYDPIYRRSISPETRKLFAGVQTKLKAALSDDGADDEEVAIAPPETAAAPAARDPAPATQPVAVAPARAAVPARPAGQPAPARPPAAPAATSPAPAGPDLFAGTPEQEQRFIDIDLRERSLTEREAAFTAREKARMDDLEAREKALERLAQTPTRYLERGEDEMIDLLREWTGATTDDELRDEATALIAGLSAKVLKIPVDPEIAAKASTRRSLQKVKAYTSEVDRKRAELDARIARDREADTKRREEEAKTAQARREEEQQRADEATAVRSLGRVLNEGADANGVAFVSRYPHLMAEENPAGLVVGLIKRKSQREPNWDPTWPEIADLAEAHFRRRNEERHKRTSHLFTPATPATPPAPPSAPAAKHQGAPAQGRGARTLSNQDTAPVPPAPPQRQPDPPPAEEPEEFDSQAYQREHRGRSLARLKAKLDERSATERQSGG